RREIGQNKASNCIRFLHIDNSGYIITYNKDPKRRKILAEKEGIKYQGTPYIPQPAEQIDSTLAQAMPGDEYEVAGKSYKLMRGIYHHPSTDDLSTDDDMAFYYSDGFFEAGNSAQYKYDEHLATASINMAFAASYLNTGEYLKRHTAGRWYLAQIGCDEQTIYVNDYDTKKPGTDSIGVMMGQKKLKDINDKETGTILIPIAIRSAGYEAEWASNVTVGDGSLYNGEHQGFTESAEKVFGAVKRYISKYNLQDKVREGKVKFWVAGYSRGGAVANILSKKLLEYEAYQSDDPKNTYIPVVYGYTFEAPQGGVDNAEKFEGDDKARYYCIHNTINYADLVPLVAPSGMGFKRYGVDHYVPGTQTLKTPKKVVGTPLHAGGGIKTVTLYSDNDPIYTKLNGTDNPEYTSRRDKMVKQLEAIDPDYVYDDYFNIATMNFIFGSMIQEVDGYKISEERFIRDFISQLQETAMTSRAEYATTVQKNNGNTYGTLQEAASGLMGIVFGLDGEKSREFVSRASTLMSRMTTGEQYHIWDDVIGDWHTLSEEKKQYYIDFINKKLEETDALELMDTKDQETVKKSIGTMLLVVLKLTDYDYGNKYYKEKEGINYDMVLLGSFLYNASRIMGAHYPEVNIAWARINDSFYDEEFQAYKVNSPVSVGKPVATVKNDYVSEDESEETDKTLVEGGKVNNLYGTNIVRLDTNQITGKSGVYESCKGETIIYDIKDETNGVTSRNQVYSDGIRLDSRGEDVVDFTVTAYSYYLGTESEKAVYKIRLYDNCHKIIVKSKKTNYAGDEPEEIQKSFRYPEGRDVTIAATIPQNMIFDHWVVTNEDGEVITDKIFGSDDSGKKEKSTFSFKVPKYSAIGEHSDYELTFTASYTNRVNEIFADIAAPVAGEKLDNQVDIFWNREEEETYPDEEVDISWNYLKDDTEEVGELINDTAFHGTTYAATFFVKGDNMDFSDKTKVTFINNDGIKSSKVTYNKDKGDIRVDVVFEPTDGESDVPDTETTDYYNLTIKAQSTTGISFEPSVIMSETFKIKAGSKVTRLPLEIEGYTFSIWDRFNSGISSTNLDIEKELSFTMPEEDCTVIAMYKPCVESVDISIAEPVAGENMAEKPESFEIILGKKKYKVQDKSIKLLWNPEPVDGNADYDTTYIAKVSLKALAGVIYLYNEDGNEVMAGNYLDIAKDIDVKVNDEEVSGIELIDDTIYYTFGITDNERTIQNIIYPENVSGLDRNVTAEEIEGMLPEYIDITVADRSVSELSVEWSEPQAVDMSTPDEIDWQVQGKINIPDYLVNSKELDEEFTMHFYTVPMERTASPIASLEPGVYREQQVVLLNCSTPDAKIYYTTDGTDPGTDGILYESGSLINIFEGKDFGSYVELRVIAKCADHKDSEIARYNYMYSNEVSVPTAEDFTYDGNSHNVIDGDKFYTLSIESGENASIDGNGNVVATDAGDVKVTAKIKDGYVWKLKRRGGEERYTTDDQTIEFTVNRASIKDAVVEEIKDQTYTGKEIIPEFKVTLGDIILEKDKDYKINASDNINIGTAKLTLEGIGNYMDSIDASFKIIKPDENSSDSDEDSELPTAESTDKAIKSMKTDGDVKDSSFGKLKLKVVKSTKNSNKLKWNKVSGATAYRIYGNKCGKRNTFKLIKTVKGNTFNHKKLKKGTYYKYIVVAVKNVNGVEKTAAVSKTIHVATKGGKFTNIKSIKLNKKKLTLKKNKSFTIKAKLTKQSKKLKYKKHVGLRYESSNVKVAKVTRKGRIKAIGKGTCYIYVYAQNGVASKIKVTVK
ncbi:MAG: chitobiase/beta-hexosaminidase C-terminal domain-containing protein, partial [Eubacterium sp.]|nr:chitobiase/beta-hexosaminidase C-terminal domain-containing protein [Eubacterium sp.]